MLEIYCFTYVRPTESSDNDKYTMFPKDSQKRGDFYPGNGVYKLYNLLFLHPQLKQDHMH